MVRTTVLAIDDPLGWPGFDASVNESADAWSLQPGGFPKWPRQRFGIDGGSRCPPSRIGGCFLSDHSQFRIFTARETTTATVTSEARDCSIINTFAQGVSGIVSVGLNAVAFVKDV